MKAIVEPGPAGEEHLRREVGLGEECLVLVHLQGAGELVLETAHGVDYAAPHQHVRRARRAGRPEGIKRQRGRGRRRNAVARPAGRHEPVLSAFPAAPVIDCSADDPDLGPGVENGNLLAQLAGPPAIVGIDETDVFAPGMRQPEIARGAHAAVRMPLVLKIAHAAVLRGIATGDLRTQVARSVVGQQQFEVGKVLRQHAFDRFRQEALLVQEDADDRNTRRAHDRTIVNGPLAARARGPTLRVARRSA